MTLKTLAKWKQNTLVLLVVSSFKTKTLLKKVQLTGKWLLNANQQRQKRQLLSLLGKLSSNVKSNGIIVTNDHMTLGVGPGQTNRVASVRIAIEQAKDRLDGAVLASDAFFPFADNVEEIAKAGIKASSNQVDQYVTKSQSKLLINMV